MRVGLGLVLATLVAGSLAGCSSPNDTDSRPITDLEVGMCFDLGTSAGGASIGAVPAVDCDEGHDAEVFYTYDLADVAAYDQDTVTTEGFAGCLAPFATYVGVDYYAPEAKDLGIMGIYPSVDTWANGDREVICALTPMAIGDTLTGSMKDARD